MEKVHLQKLRGARVALVGLFAITLALCLFTVDVNNNLLSLVGITLCLAGMFGYIFYRVVAFERTGMTVSNPMTAQEMAELYRKLMGNGWVFGGVILMCVMLSVSLTIAGALF